MTTKTIPPAVLAAVDGTPLADTARRAHETRLAANTASARVTQLKGRLATARHEDGDRAADAIEAGRPIPEPTEVRVRQELDQAVRQSQAADTVAQRADQAWRQAITGTPGADIRAAQVDARTTATTRARAALTALLDAVTDASRATAIINWIDRAHRAQHPPPRARRLYRWPDTITQKPPALTVHSMPINLEQLAELIGHALDDIDTDDATEATTASSATTDDTSAA